MKSVDKEDWQKTHKFSTERENSRALPKFI